MDVVVSGSCFELTEKLFLEKLYLKTHKLILESNSRNTNTAHGSVHASKIGWAHGKNYSTQISNQGAQADLKMYKTSKIKYLLIHNSLFKNVIFLTKEYNLYLKILQKLRCLVAFQNRPSAPMTEIYWNSNSSKDNFVKKKASLCPTEKN